MPLLLSLAVSAHAQTATLARNPERALSNLGLQNGTANWEFGDGIGLSSLRVVSLDGKEAGGAKRALQFDVVTAPNIQPWEIALRQNVGVAVARQEPLRLSFWAKAEQASPIQAGVEDNEDYHKIVWSNDFPLSATWKRYEFTGQADRDFGSDKLRFVFNMGKQKGRIWLADIRLEDPAYPLPDQAAPTGPVGTLEKPLPLAPNMNFQGDWKADWNESGLTSSATQEADGRVIHFSVPNKPANIWDARFAAGNPSPINGNDVIAVQVTARSRTKSKAAFVFQQSSATYDKFLNQSVVLTPEWKQYRFIATIDNARHFNAGETNFELHAGYDVGEIDIKNLKIEDFGNSTRDDVARRIGGETIDLWGGRPHDDRWRDAALGRIERVRKADLRVRVVDAQGRAVVGAQVEAKMTRHAFRFGTAVASGAFWTTDSPTTQKYKEIAARNFNTITFENGMKWAQQSPAQLAINADILAWAKANRIEVRGHNLVWGSFRFSPREVDGKKLADMTPSELRAAIEAHVRDYVRRYKGQVYVWDVVNEAVAERDLWERVGWDEFARVFQIVREEDPQVLLAYNDYKLFHVENETEWLKEKEVLQKLVDAGVPLDVAGEQAHLGLPLIPISTVLSNLDELGHYAKAIEITEFDLGVRDDAAQATYLRDFMTACFSNPQVVSFVQWGFWEGAHWRAQEGGHLVRRDFSFRPAMDAYRDLVYKQWWTNAQGKTDARGSFSTRGFKGDYSLTVRANGKTVTRAVKLNDQTGAITIALK